MSGPECWFEGCHRIFEDTYRVLRFRKAVGGMTSRKPKTRDRNSDLSERGWICARGFLGGEFESSYEVEDPEEEQQRSCD